MIALQTVHDGVGIAAAGSVMVAAATFGLAAIAATFVILELAARAWWRSRKDYYVWRPFERSSETSPEKGEHVDLKSEIGQVMPAVWQIVTQGSEAQRRAAVEILVDTRRRLYGVLADGPDAGLDEADEADEG